MMHVVSLCLIFWTCQASPLPESENVPKTEPSFFKKMANTIEKTQAWSTFKGWYEKAREWLVGADGFITTFYHSTGDPPKKKCKCCSRCCRRRNKKQNHVNAKPDYSHDRYPNNSSRYPYGRGYYPYGDGRTTNNYYIINEDNHYGENDWQPFDGNSAPAPFDGNGPQIVATAGNGDPGCQMDCGICPNLSNCPDCSNVDCSGCASCVSGCVGCFCTPEVLCFCFNQ